MKKIMFGNSLMLLGIALLILMGLSRTGETYTFTGFPAKKLQGWLEQLGVQKL